MTFDPFLKSEIWQRETPNLEVFSMYFDDDALLTNEGLGALFAVMEGTPIGFLQMAMGKKGPKTQVTTMMMSLNSLDMARSQRKMMMWMTTRHLQRVEELVNSRNVENLWVVHMSFVNYSNLLIKRIHY